MKFKYSDIMFKRSCLLISGAIGGVFLFLDQYLKYFARTNPEYVRYILLKFIGWEYLANSGIAFSIPFSNWLVVFLTPIVLLLVIFIFIKRKRKNLLFCLSVCLITAGAVSNFIDRLFFHFTIDYIRFFTSVINIADVMIVTGAAVWVLGCYYYKE